MTIQSLIKELEKYPKDAIVMARNFCQEEGESNEYVIKIEHNENGNYIVII